MHLWGKEYEFHLRKASFVFVEKIYGQHVYGSRCEISAGNCKLIKPKDRDTQFRGSCQPKAILFLQAKGWISLRHSLKNRPALNLFGPSQKFIAGRHLFDPNKRHIFPPIFLSDQRNILNTNENFRRLWWGLRRRRWWRWRRWWGRPRCSQSPPALWR